MVGDHPLPTSVTNFTAPGLKILYGTFERVFGCFYLVHISGWGVNVRLRTCLHFFPEPKILSLSVINILGILYYAMHFPRASRVKDAVGSFNPSL